MKKPFNLLSFQKIRSRTLTVCGIALPLAWLARTAESLNLDIQNLEQWVVVSVRFGITYRKAQVYFDIAHNLLEQQCTRGGQKRVKKKIITAWSIQFRHFEKKTTPTILLPPC